MIRLEIYKFAAILLLIPLQLPLVLLFSRMWDNAKYHVEIAQQPSKWFKWSTKRLSEALLLAINTKCINIAFACVACYFKVWPSWNKSMLLTW